MASLKRILIRLRLSEEDRAKIEELKGQVVAGEIEMTPTTGITTEKINEIREAVYVHPIVHGGILMEQYLLEMNNISKIYSNGIAANKNVNFNLKKGEIHALVGENGAGKSTLMKILFGMEPPSSGEIILRGEPVRFFSSKDAIAHGIGMVHQHFMLVESFTAAQNIILGMEPKKGLFVSEEEAVRFTKEISKKYNLEVDAGSGYPDPSRRRKTEN